MKTYPKWFYIPQTPNDRLTGNDDRKLQKESVAAESLKYQVQSEQFSI